MFTGIVLGIYAVKYMGEFEKGNLAAYLTSFSENISSGDFQYSSMLLDIIQNNLPIILAIWFLGLTMVGIPIILIIDVVKGFTIGFTLSFLIKSFGTQGIGIVLLGVLPQNLIYIPCVLFSSVIAMEFSLNILKDKMNNHWLNSIWMRIASYSFVFIAIFITMCLGFVVETYITPNLVKLIMA
jgi:stage II sporulation protein M